MLVYYMKYKFISTKTLREMLKKQNDYKTYSTFDQRVE